MAPVARRALVGRLVLTMPGLGPILGSLANPFVLGITWGLAALIMGLSFLPDSPAPKRPVPAHRKRHRSDHPALDAATTLAVTLMVGLVVFSTVSVVFPAYAAGLNVHHNLITTRITHCPPLPPFAGMCS